MQVVIGCIGLVANTVGIPLFFKIGNIFNKSLAFLAVVDNVSIISTIAQYILVKSETRTTHGPFDSRQNSHYWWDHLTLRVLKNAACDASVLVVAALAYERCYAITKPLKYRTEVSSPDRKPWKR